MTQTAESPPASGPSGNRLLLYFWAVAAVSVALVVRILLSPVLGKEFPFITLFPAVFVVATVGGFGPSVLATLLSAVAAEYLVLDLGSAPFLDRADQIGLAFYIGTGLATGLLGESRLRSQRRAAASARFAEVEADRAEEQKVALLKNALDSLGRQAMAIERDPRVQEHVAR